MDPSPLIQLKSKDHEEILDVIDRLRAEGISRQISLPQIIVCGDQSSGKSSVLEAISGLGFPTKDNVCTRFATELILRRATQSSIKVSIYPDETRPPAEKDRLRSFRAPADDLNNFASIVLEAAAFIGVDHEGYSKDVLRVEVSGPDQSHLTLVDLPGLYHAPDESQDEKGVEFVESLVLSHMHNKRSVILAVVSAKNDIALQKVTHFTRKIDPDGKRTMGVITKPDTLSSGSDMEQSFFSLATNRRLKFNLGWHVVKNRSYEERDFTTEQRHQSEQDFLSKGIWTSLPQTQRGVDSLRPRLSHVLRDHILSELPELLNETQSSLTDAESQLQRLGTARKTLSDQRLYLLRASERFTTLISSAVHGVYWDPFFGDPIDEGGYRRRLRAVVQNRLSDFSDRIRTHGEYREIVDDDVDFEPDQSQIHRSDFVDEVKQRLRRGRGRELLGTFNPLIVGDLFYHQSKPWESLASKCIDRLLRDVQHAIRPVLCEVTDDETLLKLSKLVIDQAVDDIEQSLRDKTKELLAPQQGGHPITYNRDFVDAIQNAREQHLRASVTSQLQNFFKDEYPEQLSGRNKMSFRMDRLIDALSTRTEEDMEAFASTEAVDCMQAYYTIARKKFVDDFSNLAVERCLLEPLLKLFCPSTIGNLPDEVIKDIASEDEALQDLRMQLESKAVILKSSIAQLHRLDKYKSPSSRARDPSDQQDGEQNILEETQTDKDDEDDESLLSEDESSPLQSD